MKLIFLLFGLSLLPACSPTGAPWQGYRGQAILEARNRGVTYFIHFYQPGDSLCEEQKAILKDATADPKYQKAFAYRLKWNEEPKLQAVLGVSSPCILVAFKGDEERARSTRSGKALELIQILERGL